MFLVLSCEIWTKKFKCYKIVNMRIGTDFLDAYSSPKIICNGSVPKNNGESVPYSIELGLSKSSILECNGWKDFTTNIILQYVVNAAEVNSYREILQNYIMLEDFKWNWSKKAFFFNTSEYNWFFLRTSDGVQGVCLTYHPQKSVFQSVNIFYIKYLSSAPWNRNSSLHDRQYKGIGTEILKQVQFYFIRKYHYNHGFCLHSLPQAHEYYIKIGMVNLPEYNDEDGLLFYEINRENAISFLESNNV